jgi:uncharacterized protein (TIGR03437 family)
MSTRMRKLTIFLFVAAAALAQQQVHYSYDHAGRLVRADYGAGKVIAYTYDPAGNLLKRDASGAVSFVSVNAASYATHVPLAAGMMVSGYGSGMSINSEAAQSLPLPKELAGTRVEVTDSQGTTRTAELLFVSPGLINYIVPDGTADGHATQRVIPQTGDPILGEFDVGRVSPGIFTATTDGLGVAAAYYLRVAAGGAQSTALLSDAHQAAVPVDLGPEGDAIYLLLYGTGFRNHQSPVTATVGGLNVDVIGAQAQGQFAGEDQVNIGPLPRELAGRGLVDIVLNFDGIPANTVQVSIK